MSVIFPLNLFILSQIFFPLLRSCRMSFVIFISYRFICSFILVCTIFFCLIYSSLFVTSLQFLFSLLGYFFFLISFLISSFTHGASDFLWSFFYNLLLYFSINVFSAALSTILLNSSIDISIVCVEIFFHLCDIFFKGFLI